MSGPLNGPPDAPALERALRARSIDVHVHGRGAVALLAASGGDAVGAFADPARRQVIVDLARQHGFATVALRLPDERPADTPDDPGASLPRD